MTGIIQITTIGVDSGPFNIFSNVTGFTSAFETNITRNELLLGYATNNIPLNTSVIKIVSVGECTNDLFIELTCYSFSPNDFYFTDYVFQENSTYFYGKFDGYLNETHSRLIKLNSDLTVDETFDTGTGFNLTPFDGESILEQPDGKIIAAGIFTSYNGTPSNRIIRLNTDGSIDGTFNIGTGFNNYAQGVSIDSTGSIVTLGAFTNYNGTLANKIIRLLPNGSIDSTFITGTGLSSTGIDVLINTDDSMYITGYFNVYNGTSGLQGIVKLSSTGAIDPTFVSGTGFSNYNGNPNNFARLEGESSFYVAGYFTSYNGINVNRIVKLNNNGSIDTSFSSGTGFDNIVFTINIIWEDKLFLHGEFTLYNNTPSFKNIILNADGTIFYTFDTPSNLSPYTNYFPLIIGNNIFSPTNGCYEKIYEYRPLFVLKLFTKGLFAKGLFK